MLFRSKLMKMRSLLITICFFYLNLSFAQPTDTISKAKSSGTITMGVRDSSGALSYTLGDGKYAGFHVEVCHRIIENLDKVVGKKLDVKYLSVTSQNRIPLTQNGTVDIECGSTTNNTARQKDVAFVNTTYVEEVRIAVKANSGITSISQLNGKNVATTTGPITTPDAPNAAIPPTIAKNIASVWIRTVFPTSTGPSRLSTG